MHFFGRTLLATAVALTAFSVSAKPDNAAIESKLSALDRKSTRLNSSHVF